MEDRTREDLGKAIRYIRLRNGVRQIDVAKKMRISQSSISLLESGRSNPCLFEIIEYSYHIGSGPYAIMEIATRIWCKNHGMMLGKKINTELLLYRTHKPPKQHVQRLSSHEKSH